MKRRLLEPLFIALFAVVALGGVAAGVQKFVDMHIRNLVITGSCIGCASLTIPGPTNLNDVLLGNVVGGGGYGFTPITGDIKPDSFIPGKFTVTGIQGSAAAATINPPCATNASGSLQNNTSAINGTIQGVQNVKAWCASGFLFRIQLYCRFQGLPI